MPGAPSTGADAEATDGASDISRRQLLAAVGGTGLVGGLVGYTLGNGVEATLGGETDCDPPSLSRPTDGWPKPGYDLANTGHVDGSLAPETLAGGWTADRDRGRFRQPAVANGTVLVPGVQDDTEYTSRVRALDLATGAERWRSPALCCHGSPKGIVVAGDSVFFQHEDGVAAMSLADASLIWEAPSVGSEETFVTGLPLVSDGLVHVRQHGDSGYRIDTFDARTGDHCGYETVDIDVDSFLQPAGVSASAEYVATGDSVLSLDRADLTVNWRQSFGERPWSAPRYRDGRVYVSGFTGRLFALAADTGDVEWTVEFDHYLPGGRDGNEEFAVPTPEFGAVTPDAVVVREGVFSDYSGHVKAFDPATGDLLWDRTPPAAQGIAYARPVAAGDAVYTVEIDHRADDSRLLELDVETGEQRDERRLGIEGGSELVVADGRVVVVGETGVQVVGE